MGNATTKSHYPKSLAVGARRPRWEGPGLPAPPGKPILIPGADESQPDVVAIRWERSPSNGGSAIVGYLVEHRRLGSPHWIRSTAGLCAFPELTLSGLEPGWRYQFRVRAQNALGFSQPSEISDPLTVTLQRAAASAPFFELELKDTVVLENDQAEFVVRFTGTPLPKISWFKDGFEIFSSRRTRINTDNGKSVLLIHQTALNDEGEIKCTATNRAGHVSTKAKLILEAPPKIRLPRQYEDGLLFEQDETIRLKVTLAGRPPPAVIWYHDGEIVSKDQRHILEGMDGESILKIPDAKRNDRGEYTVKATNKLGEDISSFLVTVTDRPAAPGKAMVTMTLGRSVTLSWKEPDDDGGCKIGTYIVEYYRIGWDVWLKATTSRQTSATLAELIEGSEYKFRVKAENPYGVSDPSEESDVVFIPDLKRGIVAPSLGGKSQSHREIRSREKREVSFAVPAQRTRSLTREEARRDDDNEARFGPGDRSASAQRLSGSGRPSRADSRVTFALDTFDKPEAPVAPVRSKDHSSLKQDNRVGNHVGRPNHNAEIANDEAPQPRERPTSPKPTAVVTISPPAIEETNKRASFRESRSRSVSMSRERSMSPLSMPKIQENREEDISSHRLRPSMNLALRKQQAMGEDPRLGALTRSNAREEKPGSPTTPREDDENELRGSSEFMLVLYPEDQDQDETQKLVDVGGLEARRISLEARLSTMEEIEDVEDLIPPPMSLSLPELFSNEHQVVETLREAVSSTELLHERAMERFYRAVAAEEASEVAKRKSQVERTTGELASTRSQETSRDRKSTDMDSQDAGRGSLRRRLSNSGATAQSLLSSWQVKKNRRRSSEGQAEVGLKAPLKLLPPALLPDVEARSDPNIPSDLEAPVNETWTREKEEEEAAKQLRRWHDANIQLVEGRSGEKSIPWVESANDNAAQPAGVVTDVQQVVGEEQPPEEEASLESSEESSEELSSADSEDLKLLKTRILARQVMEEEDTYHPRGTPTPHVDLEPPPIPPHKIPILDISPPTPTRSTTPVPPVSPTTVVPKSILKKRKEEPVPLNSFGRPIPPEKPIRKTPPQPLQARDEVEFIDTIPTSLPESPRPAVMSESDTDSVLSAGEAAKNRRIQAKMRTLTPEEIENEEADMEARMAVVNHYTEIVREHSSRFSYRASEERKFGDSALESRRSSFSEDQDQKEEHKKAPTPKERAEPPMPTKTREVYEVQPTQQQKTKTRNETEREDRQGSQQPSSRRGSVGSRGTTPARDTKVGKEKRASRASTRNESPAPRASRASARNESPAPRASRASTRNESPAPRSSRASARNESPAPRSRNVSVERGGGASSRSSSKTRTRAPSQERGRRPPSRTDSEEGRLAREKSVEEVPRRSKVSSRPSSRASSRSSSRDRHRATTPVETKMERLQKALESKKYRSLVRAAEREESVEDWPKQGRASGEKLAIEAKRNVRSTVDYVTDLTLLMAAVYVYLFKKEIMAIPFIALLLYRRVQEEVRGRVLRGWWTTKRKK